MSIRLGNLSTKQICDRLQINLTEQEIDNLEARRSHRAEFEGAFWHCFDIPFIIACGDNETAMFVRDIYMPYADQMKGQLQIGINSKDDKEIK